MQAASSRCGRIAGSSSSTPRESEGPALSQPDYCIVDMRSLEDYVDSMGLSRAPFDVTKRVPESDGTGCGGSQQRSPPPGLPSRAFRFWARGDDKSPQDMKEDCYEVNEEGVFVPSMRQGSADLTVQSARTSEASTSGDRVEASTHASCSERADDFDAFLAVHSHGHCSGVPEYITDALVDDDCSETTKLKPAAASWVGALKAAVTRKFSRSTGMLLSGMNRGHAMIGQYDRCFCPTAFAGSSLTDVLQWNLYHASCRARTLNAERCCTCAHMPFMPENDLVVQCWQN
jgi:hypothetical protein